MQAVVLPRQVVPAVRAAVAGNCSCALRRPAAVVVAVATSPLSCRLKRMWEIQESEIIILTRLVRIYFKEWSWWLGFVLS